MSLTINIIEETTSGEAIRRATLRLASERVTARDILEKHVLQELENTRSGIEAESENDAPTHSVVFTAHPLESKLNKPSRLRQPNAEKCVADACEAFYGNGFIMFVDNKQINDLSETIGLTENSVVTFMRLIPLAAG